MRISDWSSDVCSSDLRSSWFRPGMPPCRPGRSDGPDGHHDHRHIDLGGHKVHRVAWAYGGCQGQGGDRRHGHRNSHQRDTSRHKIETFHKWPTAPTSSRKTTDSPGRIVNGLNPVGASTSRSDEQTTEIQSLMRNSYSVF